MFSELNQLKLPLLIAKYVSPVLPIYFKGDWLHMFIMVCVLIKSKTRFSRHQFGVLSDSGITFFLCNDNTPGQTTPSESRQRQSSDSCITQVPLHCQVEFIQRLDRTQPFCIYKIALVNALCLHPEEHAPSTSRITKQCKLGRHPCLGSVSVTPP